MTGNEDNCGHQWPCSVRKWRCRGPKCLNWCREKVVQYLRCYVWIKEQDESWRRGRYIFPVELSYNTQIPSHRQCIFYVIEIQTGPCIVAQLCLRQIPRKDMHRLRAHLTVHGNSSYLMAKIAIESEVVFRVRTSSASRVSVDVGDSRTRRLSGK